MKKLFYLPIFTLVLISNTFSENNQNIYDRTKMFKNSSIVKQQMLMQNNMQNNIKQMLKERIDRFEIKTNNLPCSKSHVKQSSKISDMAKKFNNGNNNIQQNKYTLPQSLPKINDRIQMFNNSNKPQQKKQNHNIVPKTNNNIKDKVNFFQNKQANSQQQNIKKNVPVKSTTPNGFLSRLKQKIYEQQWPVQQHNTNLKNPNQTQSQKGLMKDKQQATQSVNSINRQVQNNNTNSPIHKELAQKYSNRANTSIMSQLQNIVKQVNNNTSDKDITALTNTWNNIINEAKNNKLSKEYINNAIQTVINSNINNIKASKFYKGILKDV